VKQREHLARVEPAPASEPIAVDTTAPRKEWQAAGQARVAAWRAWDAPPPAEPCECCGGAPCLQRQAEAAAPRELPAGDLVLRGVGRALDAETLDYFRGALDGPRAAVLAHVRVHDDAAAAEAASRLQARAFTVGDHIYFAAGRYRPRNRDGRRLLGHELAHTLQQRAGGVTPGVSQPGDAHERAADAFADAAMAGEDLPALPPGGARVQRQGDAGASLPGGVGTDDTAPPPGVPSNRDLINQALTSKDTSAVGRIRDYGEATEKERMQLVDIMLDQFWVGPLDEYIVEDIWKSFGDGVVAVAARNQSQWDRSIDRGAELLKLPAVRTVLDGFKSDVLGLAGSYLNVNEDYVNGELDRLRLVDKPQTSQADSDAYTRELQRAAREVLRAREAQAGLRGVPVGYKYSVGPGELTPNKVVVKYDPELRPQSPPEGNETPPLATWEAVKAEDDRLQGVVRGVANAYPPIFALLESPAMTPGNLPQDDPGTSGTTAQLLGIKPLTALEQLSKAATPEDVRSLAGTAMRGVLTNIQATRPKLQGSLDYRDLKPIHFQLFSGERTGASGTAWSQPFYKSLAQADIADHEATQFWISLGLSSLAAAAFIVAELATAGSATFFAAAGIGVAASGAQATRSWSQYLDLAAAAGSNVTKETALVEKGQANAALIEAIINTVFAFIDVYAVAASAAKRLAAEEALRAARAAEETATEAALRDAAQSQAVRKATDDIRHAVCALCFAAGTQMLTRRGYVAIEDVAVGDEVLAAPESGDGAPRWRRVVRTMRTLTDAFVEVTIGEQRIRSTPGHVWWTEDRGWLFADELRAGDRVRTSEGRTLAIDAVAWQDEVAVAYNCEVEGWHTYFVAATPGAEGIWVHNQSALRVLRPDQVYQLLLPGVPIGDREAIRAVVGNAINASGSYSTELKGLYAFIRRGKGAGFQGVTKEAVDHLEIVLRNVESKGGGVVAAVDLQRISPVRIYDLADPAVVEPLLRDYPEMENTVRKLAGEGVVAVRGKIPANAVLSLVNIPPAMSAEERRRILAALARPCR
jgi:hypothetical protein